MTVPLFGDGADLAEPDLAEPGAVEPVAGVAGEAWAARQFRGWNLRISRNRTVHRVAFLVDERGVEIPAPECHVGSFAAGRPWWRVYAPTSDEVTCGLCLTAHRGHRDLAAGESGPGQLALDIDLGTDLGTDLDTDTDLGIDTVPADVGSRGAHLDAAAAGDAPGPA